MSQFWSKWIPLNFLIAVFPLIASATIDANLITQAESGDTGAQINLAIAYQEENKLDSTHYWLLKAVSQGNTEALVLLGNLFESNESSRLSTLSIAENWYTLGTEQNLAEAELGYARVLETQFNNRRAKQVSSITVLDDQIDEDIQQSNRHSTNYLKHNQNSVQSEFVITSSILLLILFFVFVKRAINRRRNVKKNNLQNKITEQNKKIKSLQRHLASSHTQLKKNQHIIQKGNAEQSITLACAVLGFQPNRIPNEKEIKIRYKKLSRIYHPDANGSDDEMKRLNTAVKIISNYLKQRT